MRTYTYMHTFKSKWLKSFAESARYIPQHSTPSYNCYAKAFATLTINNSLELFSRVDDYDDDDEAEVVMT